MKKLTLFLSALLISASLAAQSDTGQAPEAAGKRKLTLTLEECVYYAIENSYSQRSLLLEREVNETAYRQSRLERLPQVSASASQGVANYATSPTAGENPSWTGSYGVSAGMTIYGGGQITNTIDQNKLVTEQSDYQIKQSENYLAIQVVQAFLSVVANEELLKSLREVLIASEQQMIQGGDKYRAGQILESDYLLLQAQFAGDQYNVVSSENTRVQSILALKSLLSLDSTVDLEVSAPDIDMLENIAPLPELPQVIERTLANIPDLDVERYNVMLAENNVKLSRAGYMPKLTLNGSLGSGYANGYGGWGSQVSDGFNQTASLGLSVPIFTNGRNKSNVAQSKLRVQQAELQRDQTQLDITQQVEQEYLGIVAGLKRYNAAEVSRRATLASFNAYEKQFAFGAITTADLLLQKNNYINALNEYVQSKFTYILERTILDIYMGEPVSL